MTMFWIYFIPVLFLILWIVKWFAKQAMFNWLMKKSEKIRKKLKISFNVDKVHLLYLEGLSLEREGFFKVKVDYLGLSSSWLNPVCNKPLCFLVGPTTINILNCSPEETTDESKSSSNSTKLKDKILLTKIAANLIKVFIQYFGVVFQNLSITFWHNELSIVWSCEIKAYIDNSIKTNSVCFALDFASCNLTVLNNESPVVYLSHNLMIHCFVPPQKSISSIKCKLDITRVNLDISEELVVHLLKKLNGKQSEDEAIESTKTEEITTVEPKHSKIIQKLKSIFGILPEVIKFSLENFQIVYRVYTQGTTILEKVEDGHQLQLDCHCIFSWERIMTNEYETSLDILGFAVNGTNHCKLILLKKVFSQLKINLEEELPKISYDCKIDNCHFDFVYNEVMGWQNHFKGLNNTTDSPERVIKKKAEKKPFVIQALPVFNVNISFENCSCDLYRSLEELLAPPLSSLYLGGLNVKLAKDGLSCNQIISNLALNDLYVYVNIGTILPENHSSLPCQLEDDQPACLPSSERHAWGRLFELGKLNLNCELEANNVVCKSKVTYISTEWSLAMGFALKNLSSLVSSPSSSKAKVHNATEKSKSNFMYDVEVETTNINIFSLGDKEGGYNSLLLKFDAVNIASGTSQKQMMGEAKGLILSQLTELQQLKTGDSYYCFESSRYKNNLLNLPEVTTCFTSTEQNTVVVDLSMCRTDVEWRPDLHMALYEQIKEVEILMESLKEMKSTSHAVKNEQSMPPQHTNRTLFEINIAVSDVSIQLATAPGHSFGVTSKIIKVTFSPEEKKVECPDLKIAFDGVDVFEFQNIQVQQQPANKYVTERQHMNLINPSNNLWSVHIRSIGIWFPYQFDFAESLEKFQVVIKMLKLLHKKPKPKDYVEKLPPDFTIACDYASIQFDDDPFEVRLGDNYMLLSDEIEQSIERVQKLEKKLEQIKSEKGTMLSGKKLDELRRQLLERSAQIYIERSKEMYEDRPIRKVLFRTALKGLQLAVFADESLHGRSNVLKHMATLDSDSPIPDDIQFTTLWCRMTTGKIEQLTIELRDYPVPLLTLESFSTRGMLIGSEACGVRRATRKATIKIGAPWDDLTVVKNMPPLKFYYDLKWDMNNCQIAWGANYEPTLAMASQAFELLSKASVDPSIPLPFWDKIRILLHGKLRADIAYWNILLSASTDPYNTTETLKIEWNAATIEWTNGNIVVDGDFDLLMRTASKYDDSRVMHFPDFNFSVKLNWLCKGDPNDHHNVYPTHPNHVTSKKHDSFSNFRSKNLDMNLCLETSAKKNKDNVIEDEPSVFLYASTFRWFQTYQAVVLSRVSRPIKRGKYFKNVRPRKPTLGRHLKILSVEFSFPSINATYWGSFQKDLGFQGIFGAGCVSTAYQIHVSPHPDIMLIRRPVAEWIIRGLNSSIQNVRMLLLQSVTTSEEGEENEDEMLLDDEREGENGGGGGGGGEQERDDMEMKKHYLFSVKKATYKRQSTANEELYTHRILFENFRGAWTAINRQLTLRMLEAYSKMQDLKKVLSTFKATSENADKRDGSAPLLEIPSLKAPLARYSSGEGISLLQKLVSEQSSKFIAQSEEQNETSDDTKTDEEDATDILQRNWHIEMVNSQVLLHGTETKGSIILTASNATILKRLHCPVYVNMEKLNKVMWTGHFTSLQYFSTTRNFKDLTVESIPWLTDDIIAGDQSPQPQTQSTNEDSQNDEIPLFKTSEATGSIIEIKKHKGSEVIIHELQRVIARCECEFQYVNLDDELDPVAKEYTPNTPMQKGDLGEKDVSVRTSLRLKHGKLELATSPSQYAVIADICQNLIFYTEPKKREEQDRLEKAKFKLQLSTGQDLKGDVSQLQRRVRSTLVRLRHYERKLFDYQKHKIEMTEGNNRETPLEHQLQEVEDILYDLQEEINVTKEQLFSDVDELKILINAYTDVEQHSHTPSPQKGRTSILKRIDVVFDDMQWMLTQHDGQLGIATVYVKRFRYNQLTYKDSRSEHSFEVGHFVVKNLLPNEPYREALIPHEIHLRRHLDKTVMLRIYTCVAPAVAGIMVKEHFEINVCPIAVRLTHKLVSNFENFFFDKSSKLPASESQQDSSTSFQPGIQDSKDGKMENEAKTAPFKVPPPRPPPPSRPPPPKTIKENSSTSSTSIAQQPSTQQQQQQSTQPSQQHRGSVRRKTSAGSTNIDQDAKQRRPSSLSLTSQQSQQNLDPNNPSPQGSAATPITPKTGSLKRVSSSISHRDVSSFSAADRDVNLMRERASKNQSFIYVKIPEVQVCFSYKGEKDITITDANNFNLCLPTLEYHNRTWTWQDLFQAMKKDYIQTLVPQILKEKLHLKSAGADTKPSLAKVDDSNKAKLLFGEKQLTQKKSAKKLLFGKRLKSNKSSSNEKLNEATVSSATVPKEDETVKQQLVGKGVEPSMLEHAFHRLRDAGDTKDGNQSS
uniref:FMP27/BLTP2/Hobbit GFWDK motif-containing RBG unit domain-containing protein n=1 Tax=Clytia hemisphaerica TaxID=252671 RepID=A0A7M5UVQ0_9CNID